MVFVGWFFIITVFWNNGLFFRWLQRRPDSIDDSSVVPSLVVSSSAMFITSMSLICKKKNTQKWKSLLKFHEKYRNTFSGGVLDRTTIAELLLQLSATISVTISGDSDRLYVVVVVINGPSFTI